MFWLLLVFCEFGMNVENIENCGEFCFGICMVRQYGGWSMLLLCGLFGVCQWLFCCVNELVLFMWQILRMLCCILKRLVGQWMWFISLLDILLIGFRVDGQIFCQVFSIGFLLFQVQSVMELLQVFIVVLIELWMQLMLLIVSVGDGMFEFVIVFERFMFVEYGQVELVVQLLMIQMMCLLMMFGYGLLLSFRYGVIFCMCVLGLWLYRICDLLFMRFEKRICLD